MGTKVQCKSYSPICYSVSDLSSNAIRGSWLKCYDDKTLNASHHYDHVLQRETLEDYSEIDKEVLKQAMLKHEIIFRNQVYELHRLYRIQKDFMDKLKRKELPECPRPVETPQSNAFSSQIPHEDVQNLWRLSQHSLANSSYGGPYSSNVENLQPPLGFSGGSSMLNSPIPAHNNWSSMNGKQVESKSETHPIKKFDLHLPVDEYLACEEPGVIEQNEVNHVNLKENYFLQRFHGSASENDTSDGYRSRRLDVSECKGLLTDLNEPVKDEEATVVPVIGIDPASCQEIDHGREVCSKQNSVFVGLSMDYLQSTWKGRDNSKNAKIQHEEVEGKRQKLDMLSPVLDSCPGSSSVLSWMKPKRIPCVSTSASLYKSSKLAIQSRGSEGDSHKNGTSCELQSDFKSSPNCFRTAYDYNCRNSNVANEEAENHNTAKYLRGINCTDVTYLEGRQLNASRSIGLHVGMGCQQDFMMGIEGKNDTSRWSPLRRTKPSCYDGTFEGSQASEKMEIDFLHGFSEHSSRKISSASSFQHFTTASGAPHSASQMVTLGRSLNTETAFPIVSAPHVLKDQSSLGSVAMFLQHPTELVEAPEIGNNDLANSNSEQKLSLNCLDVDNGLKDFTDSANYTTKEANVLPKSTAREILEIDLEVPVDLDTLEDVLVGQGSIMNHLENHVSSTESRKDGVQELTEIAAEAIVIISASGNPDVSSSSSEAFLTDTLHWFAEVITSSVGDSESKVCVDDDILSCGLDYFELMTLKLAETNVEDVCFSKPLMPEYTEEVTVASSLMTQRCRGKGRRGGQQRNFQRDILPTFASLTRHEVSEDLEMLEGLMRSMGHSWQIGSAKKNASKSGRARRRGRPRRLNLESGSQ